MSKSAIEAAIAVPTKVYVVIEHKTYEFHAVFATNTEANKYIDEHNREDLKILIQKIS